MRGEAHSLAVEEDMKGRNVSDGRYGCVCGYQMARFEELLDEMQHSLEQLRDLVEAKEQPVTEPSTALRPAYSVKEAGQLLGKSEQTIRRWIRVGKLDSTKSGDSMQDRHIISYASIKRYLGC